MTSRRSFLLGIGAALAAPAVVRAESLMKIAVLRESVGNATITGLAMEWEKYRTLRLIEMDIYRQMVRVVYGDQIAQHSTMQEFLDA